MRTCTDRGVSGSAQTRRNPPSESFAEAKQRGPASVRPNWDAGRIRAATIRVLRRLSRLPRVSPASHAVRTSVTVRDGDANPYEFHFGADLSDGHLITSDPAHGLIRQPISLFGDLLHSSTPTRSCPYRIAVPVCARSFYHRTKALIIDELAQHSLIARVRRKPSCAATGPNIPQGQKERNS